MKNISRLRAVVEPSREPGMNALLNDLRDRGGSVLNLHRVVAHSPRVAHAFIALARALRFETTLPRSLAELVILRTAQITGSEYELAQHRPIALACGITDAQMDALANWRGSALFDEQERIALAYVEQVATGGEVEDRVFASLEQTFDACEIIELTLTASFYVGTALLLKALEVQVETHE